jgi:hypothetical protein
MAAAGANAVMVVNPSYFKSSMTVSTTVLIISKRFLGSCIDCELQRGKFVRMGCWWDWYRILSSGGLCY